MTREYELDIRVTVSVPARVVDVGGKDRGPVDWWIGQMWRAVESQIGEIVFGIHVDGSPTQGLGEVRCDEMRIVGIDGECAGCGGGLSLTRRSACDRCGGSGDVPPLAHTATGTNNRKERPMLTTCPVTQLEAGDRIYLGRAQNREPGLYTIRKVVQAKNEDYVRIYITNMAPIRAHVDTLVEVPS